MSFIFKEIDKLRNGESINLNEMLSNRYTVYCREKDKTKTAYCFSVPIRNIKTNDIVNPRFFHYKHGSTFVGSEATVSITDKIRLLNQYGMCDIVINGDLSKKTEQAVFFATDKQRIEINPTLNGIMLTLECKPATDLPKILLRFNRSYKSSRTNSKFFSVMREKFIPFITASCIGVVNSYGKVVAPCEIYSQRLNNFEYILTFSGTYKSQNRIAIEINMQETKLFQDTTVESKNPKLNNAFGGIAYLGTSSLFGEQLLYSRLEISNIAELQSKKIIKSILHIPQLSYNTPPIAVNKISKRFCSFGSNWENRVPITDTVAVSSLSNGYYHLDLTKLLGDFRKKSENFVIRDNSSNKPVIIPTGDSFYAPQILEVKYQ